MLLKFQVVQTFPLRFHQKMTEKEIVYEILIVRKKGCHLGHFDSVGHASHQFGIVHVDVGSNIEYPLQESVKDGTR